jgi:nucleoside diphosphate kinase
MFAPSRKLVEDFAAVSISETGERHHRRQELLRDYILRTKAPFGTIRREFGETIMVNATHASDSAENAKREMDIAHIAENNLSPLIHAHLS